MQTARPAQLVLEDGTIFAGSAVGAHGIAAGEACFTTAMAGYEEAASDPSYMAQVLAFSERPAPDTPDFASTTIPSGSIAPASGARASSAAVA